MPSSEKTYTQKPFRPGQLRYKEYFKVSKGDAHLGFRKYFYFRVYHPMFPTFLFGALAVSLSLVAKAHFSLTLGTVGLYWLLGFVFWTFAEYFIHRFLFHWDLPASLKKNFPDLHPAHHRDTKDRSLHIAPQAFALSVNSIFFFLLWAVTQNWGLALLLISGISWGYILYEWCHYGSHEYRWKKGYLAYLKRNHLYHHFKTPDKVFGVGVSGSFWDRVFGTPMKQKTKTQVQPA